MSALAAYPVNVHAVVVHREPTDLLQLRGRQQVVILHLPHLPAAGTYQMAVVLVPVGTLVGRHVSPELVLYHQPAIEQQVNGVVQGGAAHPKVHLHHRLVERVDIEMALRGVYVVEYGESFGCLPMLMQREVLCELLVYPIFQLQIGIHVCKIMLFFRLPRDFVAQTYPIVENIRKKELFHQNWVSSVSPPHR